MAPPTASADAAYQNDHVPPEHSCAGQDGKVRDAKGFVAVPGGLCTTIDGGGLKAM